MSTTAHGSGSTNVARFDLPETDEHSETWWQSLNDGVLLLEHCTSCRHLYFYPRGMCPKCWTDQVEWVPSSGRGRVYTFSIVRMNDLPPFGQRVPYVVAMVDLEEGPRIMATLADVDVDDVKIGLPVRLSPRTLNERYSALEFVPAVV